MFFAKNNVYQSKNNVFHSKNTVYRITIHWACHKRELGNCKDILTDIPGRTQLTKHAIHLSDKDEGPIQTLSYSTCIKKGRPKGG